MNLGSVNSNNTRKAPNVDNNYVINNENLNSAAQIICNNDLAPENKTRIIYLISYMQITTQHQLPLDINKVATYLECECGIEQNECYTLAENLVSVFSQSANTATYQQLKPLVESLEDGSINLNLAEINITEFLDKNSLVGVSYSNPIIKTCLYFAAKGFFINKDLTDANLSGFDFAYHDQQLNNTILTNCILDQCKFTPEFCTTGYSSVKNCEGCQMNGVDLSNLSKISPSKDFFTFLNTNNINYAGIILNDDGIVAAHNAGIDLKKCSFKEVRFLSNKLSGISLAGIDLAKCEHLNHTADLSDCDLRGCILPDDFFKKVTKFENIKLDSDGVELAIKNQIPLKKLNLFKNVKADADKFEIINKIKVPMKDGIPLKDVDLLESLLKNMSEVSIRNADFSDCDLSGYNLPPEFFRVATKIDKIRLDTNGINVAKASPSVFKKIDFTKSNLSGIRFGDVDLSTIDFSNSQFPHASFTNCNLENAIFTNCDLRMCEVPDNFFKQVKKIDGCLISKKLIGTAIKSNIDLRRFNFTNHTHSAAGILHGEDFEEGNISGVDFTGSNLTSFNFEQLKLEFEGANFTRCHFSNSILPNNFFNKVTKYQGVKLEFQGIEVAIENGAELSKINSDCVKLFITRVLYNNCNNHVIIDCGKNEWQQTLAKKLLGNEKLSDKDIRYIFKPNHVHTIVTIKDKTIKDKDTSESTNTDKILLITKIKDITVTYECTTNKLDEIKPLLQNINTWPIYEKELGEFFPNYEYTYYRDLLGMANFSNYDFSAMKEILRNFKELALKANFEKAKLDGVTFESANLAGANLNLTSICGTKFTNAKFGEEQRFKIYLPDLSAKNNDEILTQLDYLFNHLNNPHFGSVLSAIDSIDNKYAGLKIDLMNQVINWINTNNIDIQSIIAPLNHILLDANFNYLDNKKISDFVENKTIKFMIEKANNDRFDMSSNILQLMLNLINKKTDSEQKEFMVKNNGFFIQLICQSYDLKDEQLSLKVTNLHNRYEDIPYIKELTNIANDENLRVGLGLDKDVNVNDKSQNPLILFSAQPDGNHGLVVTTDYMNKILYQKQMKNPTTDWEEIQWAKVYWFNGSSMIASQQMELSQMVATFPIFKHAYENHIKMCRLLEVLDIMDLKQYTQNFKEVITARTYDTKLTSENHRLELNKIFNKLLIPDDACALTMEFAKEIALKEDFTLKILETFKPTRYRARDDHRTALSELNISIGKDDCEVDKNEFRKNIEEYDKFNPENFDNLLSDERGTVTIAQILDSMNTTYDTTRQAQILLLLGAVFINYSSSTKLGKESNSPEAIRYFAYALIKAARKIDPSIINNNLFESWEEKLLGLGNAFTCTAILTGSVLNLCKDFRDYEGIIPVAWI